MMTRMRVPSPMYMFLHLPDFRGRESPLDGCLGGPRGFDERADPRALDPSRP